MKDHTTARVSLSEEVILAAAERIALESGVSAVTMRSLGEALGVDSTATYRYFRTKEELLTALFNRMLSRLADRFPATDDWRSDLRHVAHSVRGSIRRHPEASLVLMSLPKSGINLSLFTDPVIDILQRAGLSGENAMVAYQMFENAVTGASFVDMGNSPDNWTDRLRRYRAVESLRPAQWVRDADAVERVAERAFGLLVESLIDQIAALADQPAPVGQDVETVSR